MLEHLDSDLRRHLSLGHEVVKSICEGVTETDAVELVKGDRIPMAHVAEEAHTCFGGTAHSTLSCWSPC